MGPPPRATPRPCPTSPAASMRAQILLADGGEVPSASATRPRLTLPARLTISRTRSWSGAASPASSSRALCQISSRTANPASTASRDRPSSPSL